MKKYISLISVLLLSMVLLFGFAFGYAFKESQIDDKKDKCYVDGGWNCE